MGSPFGEDGLYLKLPGSNPIMDIRVFLKRKKPITPSPPSAEQQIEQQNDVTPSPPRVLSTIKKLLYTPGRVGKFIDSIISKRRSDLESKGKKATGQSTPVSISDYAELGAGALDELIAKGKQAKGGCVCLSQMIHTNVTTHHSLCVAGHLVRVLPDSHCVYTIGGPGHRLADQPIPYPEFNTDALAKGKGSLKFKLYQAAAVFNTAQQYNLTREQLVEHLASRDDFECSHLCRYAQPIRFTTPDGVERSAYTITENRACFALNHLICEPAQLNRARIKCPGGDICSHYPPCIMVNMPGLAAIDV